MSDPDRPEETEQTSPSSPQPGERDRLAEAGFRQRLQETQRLEAVGRLASGMAHDFNNLLAAIDGNAQMALMDAEPDHPLRASLEDIRTSVRRGRALTHQMLAFSRRQVLEPVVLDLNQTVARFDKILRRLLGDAIELDFQPQPGLGKVFADPNQIEQILICLAAYSRNSTDGRGLVTIETSNAQLGSQDFPQDLDLEPGPYICLKMTDDGRGLSADEVPHVFDPFFTTDNLASSLGLGLASVHGVVRQHEGFVQVASEPGEGTTFQLCFPRVPARIDAGQGARRPSGLPTGCETILLVEDDAAVRDMIHRILERLGYRVLEAASAGEALRLSEEVLKVVDLLLTDVVMPGQSGRELTETLLKRLPELRTLFISGFPEDVVNRHQVSPVGPDFLAKPFTPSVLARRVRAALDGSSVGMR